MIDVEKVKKHLNIDDEYNGDDNYIASLISVAKEIVEKHINQNLTSICEENDGILPKALEQAMLLLIGTYYANRETITYTSATELPLSYSYILDLYKCYHNTYNK